MIDLKMKLLQVVSEKSVRGHANYIHWQEKNRLDLLKMQHRNFRSANRSDHDRQLLPFSPKKVADVDDDDEPTSACVLVLIKF